MPTAGAFVLAGRPRIAISAYEFARTEEGI
jgi:hypothetical protein